MVSWILEPRLTSAQGKWWVSGSGVIPIYKRVFQGNSYIKELLHHRLVQKGITGFKSVGTGDVFFFGQIRTPWCYGRNCSTEKWSQGHLEKSAKIAVAKQLPAAIGRSRKKSRLLPCRKGRFAARFGRPCRQTCESQIEPPVRPRVEWTSV